MKRQKIRKLTLLVSFILFPLTYFMLSPEFLQFWAAEGVLTGDAIFFGGLFLFSIFGGRLFCGWICHMGALQESAFIINDRPANNKWNWVKFLSFIPWISLFALLAVSSRGFQAMDFFYEHAFGMELPAIGKWMMYLGIIVIILTFVLIKGKRASYHYLCWISPFMILRKSLSKALNLPFLHLKTTPESCTSCGTCIRACPMSLPVKDFVQLGAIRHSEFILCGACVDSCPERVIKYCFSRKN